MTDEDADYLPTVIIYDGMCHLCSGSMAWLAHRVPEDRLKFAPVQSAEGAKALQSAGLNEFDPNSFFARKQRPGFEKEQRCYSHALFGWWSLESAGVGVEPTAIVLCRQTI
jgi:predicted DCC family thiol-disulfide oxidoreductase YuxK